MFSTIGQPNYLQIQIQNSSSCYQGIPLAIPLNYHQNNSCSKVLSRKPMKRHYDFKIDDDTMHHHSPDHTNLPLFPLLFSRKLLQHFTAAVSGGGKYAAKAKCSSSSKNPTQVCIRPYSPEGSHCAETSRKYTFDGEYTEHHHWHKHRACPAEHTDDDCMEKSVSLVCAMYLCVVLVCEYIFVLGISFLTERQIMS